MGNKMIALNAFPFESSKEKQEWYNNLHASVKESNAHHLMAYTEGQIAWHKGLCPDECPYLDIANGALQSNAMNIASWMKGWSDSSRVD